MLKGMLNRKISGSSERFARLSTPCHFPFSQNYVRLLRLQTLLCHGRTGSSSTSDAGSLSRCKDSAGLLAKYCDWMTSVDYAGVLDTTANRFMESHLRTDRLRNATTQVRIHALKLISNQLLSHAASTLMFQRGLLSVLQLVRSCLWALKYALR